MKTAKGKVGTWALVAAVVAIIITVQLNSNTRSYGNFENIVAATGRAVESYVDNTNRLPENYAEIAPFYSRNMVPSSEIPEGCAVTFNFNKGKSFLTVHMTCGAQTIRGYFELSARVTSMAKERLK